MTVIKQKLCISWKSQEKMIDESRNSKLYQNGWPRQLPQQEAGRIRTEYIQRTLHNSWYDELEKRILRNLKKYIWVCLFLEVTSIKLSKNVNSVIEGVWKINLVYKARCLFTILRQRVLTDIKCIQDIDIPHKKYITENIYWR